MSLFISGKGSQKYLLFLNIVLFQKDSHPEYTLMLVQLKPVGEEEGWENEEISNHPD